MPSHQKWFIVRKVHLHQIGAKFKLEMFSLALGATLRRPKVANDSQVPNSKSVDSKLAPVEGLISVVQFISLRLHRFPSNNRILGTFIDHFLKSLIQRGSSNQQFRIPSRMSFPIGSSIWRIFAAILPTKFESKYNFRFNVKVSEFLPAKWVQISD